MNKHSIVFILFITIANFFSNTAFALVTEGSYQIAEAIFLPDYVEKEMKFDANSAPGNSCAEYRFTHQNCPLPRTPSVACPSDPTKFKYCDCDKNKYIFDANSCKYTAQSPYFENKDRLLGGDLCQNGSTTETLASDCNCKYFRYTTDASCGDAERIIDTRSSCQERDGQVRYENCRCNPSLYPYSFVGKLRSQAFLDEVAKHCGNENNFEICQNYGEEIAFRCAVDTKYKYDSYSCKTENPAYEVGGEYIKFFNGYGNDITLYTSCDCPFSYSSNCNGAYGSQFYGKNGTTLECRRKSPQCQMGFYQGLADKGLANCYDNIHGSVIKVADTCVRRDGTKVYRCECSGRGNWGFSGTFCGTCVQNSDHIVCIENGKEISSSCFEKI